MECSLAKDRISRRVRDERFAGGVVVAAGIIGIISNILNPFRIIRSIWNIIFGALILSVQFKLEKYFVRRFGFMSHWFLRAIFYVFVGTNSLDCETGVTPSCIVSGVACIACSFVGFVDLAFGFKCAKKSEEAEAAGGGARAQTVPTGGSTSFPSITITPSQALQGASWMAKAQGAMAKSGAPAPPPSGGATDNPFFSQNRT
jgi:hypothetical protein